MKYIVERARRFCGFITGFVFYISGILKLLDPVGAGLVMDEYLSFLHISFLGFASKTLGFLFALAETLIGAALITGVWRKVTAVAAMAFQAFFTLLTLILVIFNPDMDCGCFGEAIHLTHLQTFLKNIVLCILLGCAFIPFRGFGRPKRRKYVSFALVAVSTAAFGIYSWLYIPLVDFTDYKPATELQNASQTNEEDRYEAVFIYEKDGVQESFTLEHLPDSSWTFVSTETRLKEGYDNIRLNLSFYGNDGEYADSLASEGKVIVISVYDTDIRPAKWAKTANFLNEVRENGFTPLLLVASAPDLCGEMLDGIATDTADTLRRHMYFCDYKTLVTMNRSNGGATYFSEGYLIRKWAGRNLPDSAELHEVATGDDTEAIIGQSTRSSLSFQAFLLYVFAIMLLL